MDYNLQKEYFSWKANPQDLAFPQSVDRIIFKTISRTNLRPFYHKYEEYEDLIQELRYVCFKRLKNLQDPTSKRIYNFLRVTIDFTLKEQARRVGKLIDRKECTMVQIKEPIYHITSNLFFVNDVMNDVALLLIQKYSKKEISKELGIPVRSLNKFIQKIKKELQ
jgi:hypothetical protein